jgi:hypothetical protein
LAFNTGYVEAIVSATNNATLEDHGALFIPIIEPHVPSFPFNAPISDALRVDFLPTLAIVTFWSYDDKGQGLFSGIAVSTLFPGAAKLFFISGL